MKNLNNFKKYEVANANSILGGGPSPAGKPYCAICDEPKTISTPTVKLKKLSIKSI